MTSRSVGMRVKPSKGGRACKPGCFHRYFKSPKGTGPHKLTALTNSLSAWLDAAGISDGYVFQTMGKGGVPTGRPVNPGEVARLVKRYAAKIGLDPADYSAYSLRAGFVTSAAAHRARLDKIVEVTRHRNPATVLGYIRDAECFADHAGVNFL